MEEIPTFKLVEELILRLENSNASDFIEDKDKVKLITLLSGSYSQNLE